MSTEQDKDAFSLKRHRGGDGGLEGLGGPGVLLGPDKKKRKSNPQTPSFSTLTEYAPPPNPSADHLVAANPFDDSYNVPSFKPLSAAGPYFGHPQHQGLGGYGPPRMAPLMSHRMPSPYGGLYQMRNQLHPFPQNQMAIGFSRPLGFHYGHQENPSFRNQPPFSNNSNNNMPLPPNHLFRLHPEDNLNQGPLHSVSQSTPPDYMGPSFGAETNPSGNPPPRPNTNSSPGFTQQENSFSQSNTPTPKADSGDLSSKSASRDASPRKASHTSEEVTGQSNSVDLKSKNRGPVAGQEGGPPNAAEKRNGIIHLRNEAPKKSPQPGGPIEAAPLERGRAGGGSGGGVGGGGLASNKTGRHPNRSSHWSAEPVYPCGICLSEVNDDQEAILCEASCQKWFHRVCTGMTETAYNLLTAEVCAVWGCDTCMEQKGTQLFRTKESTGQPAISSEG